MKRTILILLLTASFTLAQENSWEIIGNMFRPVAGGSEWVDRENIYILGGYSDSLQVNVNWVQKYSTFLVIWKQIGHMQEPRFGLVADRFGEEVFLFGGVQELKLTRSRFVGSWWGGQLARRFPYPANSAGEPPAPPLRIRCYQGK